MGLFSKKQELTQDDKDMLLTVLSYDKMKWDRTFPFPNFDIASAMSKLKEGKELANSDIEACKSAIKRYVTDHKGADDLKVIKQIGKKL